MSQKEIEFQALEKRVADIEYALTQSLAVLQDVRWQLSILMPALAEKGFVELQKPKEEGDVQ